MDSIHHFLGTGWSFPPAFSVENGGPVMVSEETDIRQSLGIIFSTGLGERILRPEFGCDLRSVVFQSIDATQRTHIRDLIEVAVLENEPRIVLKKIIVDDSHIGEGLLNIQIDYLITATNARSNLVYPYYFREGVQPR